jgi:hypothetical protein
MHRFGFQCVYCGRTAKEAVLEVDHVIPIADGGTNDENNLVPACVKCNMGKGAKRLAEMPDAIKHHVMPAEFADWSADHIYGGMIAGCLFVPPIDDRDMRLGRGIAICLARYLQFDLAMAKAHELREDRSLDNYARWNAFMSWMEDDEGIESTEGDVVNG